MNKKTALIMLLAIILIGAIGISAYFLKGMERQKNRLPIQPRPTVSPQSFSDTSDWQVYRNERYGFEIKYPLLKTGGFFWVEKKPSPIRADTESIELYFSESGDIEINGFSVGGVFVYRLRALIEFDAWLNNYIKEREEWYKKAHEASPTRIHQLDELIKDLKQALEEDQNDEELKQFLERTLKERETMIQQLQQPENIPQLRYDTELIRQENKSKKIIKLIPKTSEVTEAKMYGQKKIYPAYIPQYIIQMNEEAICIFWMEPAAIFYAKAEDQFGTTEKLMEEMISSFRFLY